ncbi:MAG: single-stranded-DNA-specific exonuclease RecJ [Patescibacteria group bacterium]|jgi:single-stranded-DNA-specific exonuclease
MSKRWVVADQIPLEVRDQFPELHPVILQLLHNRGLTTDQAMDEFMKPDFGRDVPDPFLFREMRVAVDRIKRAILEGEPIVVHGDYDADGVSGAAVLVSALQMVAPKNSIEVYLPHREIEGYGLNMDTVKELARRKTKLIITVDCGTTNVEEITSANQLGMDVIVTDHHTPSPERPPAIAILNPWLPDETYPFKHLCGAGVAFKLAQALLREYNFGEAEEKWLMDLVAIGTIADYVPLIGENRTLVKYGLIVLAKTRRPGLRQLYLVMNMKTEGLDTRTVSFQIVPRINAAGRVDHANAAYELLMAPDDDAALAAAQNLHQLNQDRQRITERITQEARTQIGVVTDMDYILFAQGDDWPAGLVGLVASRIMDEFNRPTIIIGKRQDLIVGSGRSVKEFHITEALREVEHLLSHYGGHRQACGFTMRDAEMVGKFKKLMSQLAVRDLKSADRTPELQIDAAIGFDQIDWPLVEMIGQFSPFGEGNPVPAFLTEQLEVLQWDLVGAGGKHLRLTVRDNSMTTRKMIGFGFGSWAEQLTGGDRLSAVYEIGVNSWNGNQELQLKIIDLKKDV